MESVNGPEDDPRPDPQAQLALLKKVQDATEVEAWMPTTPLWHAPLMATFFAAFHVQMSNLPESWHGWATALSWIVLGVGLVDSIRRQRVLPRRLRRPARAIGFYLYIIAVVVAILMAWGLIDWPQSTAGSLLVLIVAWLVTTVVIGAGMMLTNRLRDQWAGAR